MAEIKRMACDMCGSEAEVRQFAISERPNMPFIIDLCEDHAAPLDDLREHGRGSAGRRPYRKYRKLTN